MAQDNEHGFTVTVEHVEGLEFRVRFDWPGVDDLVVDEPPPLGKQKGPNAARLMGAAVVNCLSASLLFCLQRSRVEVRGLKASVRGRIVRNDKQRLRVGGMAVRIELDTPVARERLTRCFELFEDFCVVTQSVRQGVPVSVEVVDPSGTVLHAG